jgi:hypothetical protein
VCIRADGERTNERKKGIQVEKEQSKRTAVMGVNLLQASQHHPEKKKMEGRNVIGFLIYLLILQPPKKVPRFYLKKKKKKMTFFDVGRIGDRYRTVR